MPSARTPRVLAMVRGVRALGMEACCTLGMLTQEQADALAGAGCSAYNHNLDTSPEFYGSIITTRTYDDRLETLKRVRQAGITVCCGGIIGMGEDRGVRYRLLQQLASLDPHPESVPVNLLVRVDGTPLADRAPEDPLELVRTIATARILMPASFVRLSAGRMSLTDEAQALCFLAGANSVFLGDCLLTTPNPGAGHDEQLFDRLGVAAGRIELEDKSRNTFENALFSKALVMPKPGERWLLVTSAYHMPRAVGVFRQAGFPVEAYPVDWRTRGSGDFARLFSTVSEGLSRTDTAVHEWLGLMVYRLTDRSSELFPGP